MKGITIFFIILLVSCSRKVTDDRVCNLDTLDYKIYSLLLEKYAFPEIDSTLSFDEKNEKILFIKNPRRNLLLIDSTKIYGNNENEPYLTSDSLLFNNFKKQNSFKCKLDTAFNKSILLYSISEFEFHSCFKKDFIKGYDYLYDKYKDVTGIVEFSKIGYNKEKTKALVEICLYLSPKNSFGLFLWLNYENGKWILIAEKTDWMS